MPIVTPNVFGDLLVDPATQAEAFDAVHTFAIVRMTLTMYERGMAGATLPWQWNSGGNADPLRVFPRAGVTQNAFYSRNEKALKFFFFNTGTPPTQVFTCRSLDIVAHETGHAILDALKPGWLLASNPPQTGGLHESFGDLTAIFLALNQLDQCEALIAQTKADLHAKNFLSDLAEQFGLALGRPNGLRNADNNLRLSEAGTEVHAISQVFTGGMFDVLADLFALERAPDTKDDAAVLHDVAGYLASVLIRGLRAAPNTAATYAHVVNKMLGIVVADGKPPAYRQALVNAFSAREVIAPTALSLNGDETVELEAAFTEDPNAPQDRSTCCGTMQLPEFMGQRGRPDAPRSTRSRRARLPRLTLRAERRLRRHRARAGPRRRGPARPGAARAPAVAARRPAARGGGRRPPALRAHGRGRRRAPHRRLARRRLGRRRRPARPRRGGPARGARAVRARSSAVRGGS